jgi:hypothetical protein
LVILDFYSTTKKDIKAGRLRGQAPPLTTAAIPARADRGSGQRQEQPPRCGGFGSQKRGLLREKPDGARRSWASQSDFGGLSRMYNYAAKIEEAERQYDV